MSEIQEFRKAAALAKWIGSIVVTSCVATAGGVWNVSNQLNDLKAADALLRSKDAEIAKDLSYVDKNGTTYGKELTIRRDIFEKEVFQRLTRIEEKLEARLGK